MAVRARLAPTTPEAPRQWPWHEAKWASLASSLFWRGDRRMEAETYLTSGYGLRLAIQGRAAGWQPFHEYARIWQPSRLKGIQVGPEFGTPFLAATQVFDIRPVPRKWLALEHTHEAQDRFASNGTIVVTCSGAVGRATLLHSPHENTLISHDLLRIEAKDSEQWGWIYGFLRSPQARAMMTSAKYGHMIKHLETSHLDALPVPVVNAKIARQFRDKASEILDLRNRGYKLAVEAEQKFEETVGSFRVRDWGESGFSLRASASLFGGRRRLEGVFHNPAVGTIKKHLAKNGRGFSDFSQSGFDVWLPTRFRRIPAADGVRLVGSADLFETNPDLEKRIADVDFGDSSKGRVKSGWLLLSRSGQTYGLNGTLVIGTEALEDCVVSDHVIRIAPRADASMRVGYVHTALSHPILGRPLVKALAYGSSIPEIDPTDFSRMQVVRIGSREENAIADLAEESAALRAKADIRERELAAYAGELIAAFIAGTGKDFVSTVSPRSKGK